MFTVFKSITAKFRNKTPLSDYAPDPYWDWEELVTPHFGYNRWLEDYLMQGGRITHFEPYRYPNNAKVVSDPHTYEQIPHKEEIPTMQGPVARSYILSPKYDAKEHASQFISDESDNILYGWTNEGEKAVVLSGGNLYVPGYTDTVDKELVRRADAPEELRQHIREGAGKSREQVIMRVLRRKILKRYNDSIIDGIVAAGKARKLSGEELQAAHPKFAGIDMWGAEGLYITDPENVTIPPRFGAYSLYIVLDPKYDVIEHQDALMPYFTHNILAGWSDGEPVVVPFQERKMPLSAGQQEYLDALKWFTNLKADEPEVAWLKSWTMDIGYVGIDHAHLYDDDSQDAPSETVCSLSPWEYLGEIFSEEGGTPAGEVKLTFTDADTAVLTTINGEEPTFPLVSFTFTPLIFREGDLTGNTYSIESVKLTSAGEPVEVTIRR